MNIFLVSSDVQCMGKEFSFSLELFLSIIAIIISILSVIFEYYWNQKINKTNLEADFFMEIYGDFLMKKIPEARNMILYNNHIISDTDDLIEVLNDIRRSSLFYKYKDKRFYKNLCNKLQNLEDDLVKNTGTKFNDDEKYVNFANKVNSDIEKIYSLIMDKYIGK